MFSTSVIIVIIVVIAIAVIIAIIIRIIIINIYSSISCIIIARIVGSVHELHPPLEEIGSFQDMDVYAFRAAFDAIHFMVCLEITGKYTQL